MEKPVLLAVTIYKALFVPPYILLMSVLWMYSPSFFSG
jgi:hypothetical protein